MVRDPRFNSRRLKKPASAKKPVPVVTGPAADERPADVPTAASVTPVAAKAARALARLRGETPAPVQAVSETPNEEGGEE